MEWTDWMPPLTDRNCAWFFYTTTKKKIQGRRTEERERKNRCRRLVGLYTTPSFSCTDAEPWTLFFIYTSHNTKVCAVCWGKPFTVLPIAAAFLLSLLFMMWFYVRTKGRRRRRRRKKGREVKNLLLSASSCCRCRFISDDVKANFCLTKIIANKRYTFIP